MIDLPAKAILEEKCGLSDSDRITGNLQITYPYNGFWGSSNNSETEFGFAMAPSSPPPRFAIAESQGNQEESRQNEQDEEESWSRSKENTKHPVHPVNPVKASVCQGNNYRAGLHLHGDRNTVKQERNRLF